MAIQVRLLQLEYNGRPVLCSIDLEVKTGEIVILIGSNGSGKTTLLRCIAGLITDYQGSVATSGKISYFGHKLMLYPELTVAENLEFFGRLSGVALKEINQEMQFWNLWRLRDQTVATLSQGNKERVALARTFQIDAPILLLDEPSSSLDDATVEKLCTRLASAQERNRSIILATHDSRRLNGLSARFVRLEEGVMVTAAAA